MSATGGISVWRAVGIGILGQFLDRTYLDRFPSMGAAEKSATILKALRAIKYLKIRDLS